MLMTIAINNKLYFMKWCNSVAPGSIPVTIEDFKRKKLLQKAIQKGLERANEIATANPCKVKKFTILPEELSVQGGELGPTLKLKRHAITTKYQNLIDVCQLKNYIFLYNE